MKSELNFMIQYTNGKVADMHNLGLWVDSFHIHSPESSHDLIEIPKLNGARLISTKIRVRKVEISFLLETNSLKELDTLKHLVYDTFYDTKEYKIIRDISPNSYFYAMQDGSYDVENISCSDGEFSLSLIMLDPYIYGQEFPYFFNSSGILELINDGSVDMFPTYELNITKDTTFLSLIHGDSHISIGKPAETESEVTIERDLILYEKFDSMAGWNPGSSIQDGFVQMGSIYVKNGNFEPQSFGGNVDIDYRKWRGPAYVKELSRSVQDFYLEMFMDMKSYKSTPAERAKELGRIAIWLLDINNQVIGKMFVEDPTEVTMMVKGVAKLGPEAATKTIMEYSNPAYNQFDGLITIQREGKWWYFQIGMYDSSTGRRHGRYNAKFYDSNDTYQTRVAKIQVGFMQFQNYSFPSMLLDTLRFYELNGTGEVTQDEVQVIAQSGDKIEIETSTGQMFRNGEPWYKNLDPTSHFFPIKPGIQRIHLYPVDIGVAKARCTKRWL